MPDGHLKCLLLYQDSRNKAEAPRRNIGRGPLIYPVLFRIGEFDITSFGALVAAAALVGLWVFRRELPRSGLPDSAVDAAIAGVIGGLFGAKLLWVFEHLHEEPFADLLLSRGGMSWFGGFAGGVLAGLLVMRWTRLPMVTVLAAATPALAIGQSIGRIGCFLVGDDYGRPTSLPWGVAFPKGLPPTIVPVHPTQLYEAAARRAGRLASRSLAEARGGQTRSCSAPIWSWLARSDLRSNSSASTSACSARYRLRTWHRWSPSASAWRSSSRRPGRSKCHFQIS